MAKKTSANEVSMEIKRTERGWPGHFCCAQDCHFRRNTLLAAGGRGFVVSSVGNLRSREDGKVLEIGSDNYYETLVFRAYWQGSYIDADTTHALPFHSPGTINRLTNESDNEANAMHEAVVEEIIGRIKQGEVL